jgi:hypothetical protein
MNSAKVSPEMQWADHGFIMQRQRQIKTRHSHHEED